VYLEEEICPWLTNWGASELAPAGFTLQWLEISINVIKFNATYLDDEVINTVVQYVYSVTYTHTHIYIYDLKLLCNLICIIIYIFYFQIGVHFMYAVIVKKKKLF